MSCRSSRCPLGLALEALPSQFRGIQIIKGRRQVDGDCIGAYRFLAVAQTRKRTRAVMQPDPDRESAGAEMHLSIMTAFCEVLRTTPLPPMTVVTLAASALGTIYREVADQHRPDGGCPCGWKPNLRADVEALQAALAATTQHMTAVVVRV